MRGRAAVWIAMILVSAGVLAATPAAAAGGSPSPQTTTGVSAQLVASGLKTPTSFAFGDGTLFEGDGGTTWTGGGNGGLYVLKGGSGIKLPGSPRFIAGMAWHDNALWTSGGGLSAIGVQTWQIQRWSGWNGERFAKRTAIYTGPKGFNGFNGLAFGPDGRIYVGVDTGLTDRNDHGPANTSRYVYDIVSMNTSGKAFKVYARGIRQPWQLVFPAGSDVPFVSDLGQDADPSNPPDFLLRVHAGDNYGFPKCNWTTGSPCAGFTRPYKLLPPHTDLMGLAIIGDTLYMTSYIGLTDHEAADGEVVDMPLTGGTIQPVVTGFTAPVVGLAAIGGWLYFGDLNGDVWRVRP